ncbi:conserved uncharacterized protein, DUF218 [Desulfosarcina variabilis str. Montpellier]
MLFCESVWAQAKKQFGLLIKIMMPDAFELLIRVLCDRRPPAPADAAYLYCTTTDNQMSVFRAARNMVDQRLTKKILVYQSAPMGGYPGGDQCKAGLQAAGVPAGHICDLPSGETDFIHTLIESQTLVRYAKDQGLISLLITSPPFHQLRAFMTAVSVALQIYPELMIFSYPGSTLPWMETVTHSQGTLQAPRRQLIKEELIRIEAYQNKGDLAHFEPVLSYMNQRDG